MPFFVSLYPKPTCDEIKGAGFTHEPAWTSSTTEMQGWVSQEYLLHRSQIKLNANTPMVSLNELRWETLKADYWLAHHQNRIHITPAMGAFSGKARERA